MHHRLASVLGGAALLGIAAGPLPAGSAAQTLICGLPAAPVTSQQTEMSQSLAVDTGVPSTTFVAVTTVTNYQGVTGLVAISRDPAFTGTLLPSTQLVIPPWVLQLYGDESAVRAALENGSLHDRGPCF